MKSTQTTFVGGIMSPEMYGHADDAKLRSGLREARNYLITPAGGARRRPGSRFVSAHKNSAQRVRLIKFRYSIDQTAVVQAGAGYFRFHAQKANLLYATPRTVLSVDTTAETLTFTAPHNFLNNDAVRVFNTGGAAPGGITTGTTYYVIVVDSTRIQLCATPLPGSAVNLTGSGSGTTRVWLNSDTPRVYVGSKNVTAALTVTFVDTGTGELTTSSAHYLSTGDPVVAPSTAVAGLTVGVTYYAIVTTPTKFQVATTYANAIGGVPIVPFVSTTGTMSYVNKIACSIGHSLSTGDPVNFSVSGGTLIGGLTLGETYYAIVPNNTAFYLALSRADALAGTRASIVSNPGTGTPTFHFVYEAGDLVTNINTPQGFWVCTQRNPQANAPTTPSAYWYLLPSDGTLELPNSYAEADLGALDFAQSGDLLRIVHPSYPPYDLRRLSATNWAFTPAQVAPLLGAPTGLACASTYGRGVEVSTYTVAATTVISTFGPHFATVGDTVCMLGSSEVPDGIYTVATVTAVNALTLSNFSTGLTVGATATSSTGRLQPCTGLTRLTESYRVTAVDVKGLESQPASVTSGVNNLLVEGAANTLTWTPVVGAVRYNVYKEVAGASGLYGFVGSSDTASFTDDNIDPDASVTPPKLDLTLTTNWPGAVAFWEQRTIYGGFNAYPQRLLMSRPGADGDFGFHIPTLDSDSINRDVQALELCRIQFLVPATQLLVMTDSTEFRATTADTEVVSPKSLGCRPFSYVGAAKVKPIVTNGSVVFAAARGGHVYEMGFSSEAGGFVANDLCYRTAHLFDNLSITAAGQQRAPWSINWFVSSNGTLLAHTYVPSEQVGAWHRHDTDGTIEDVCCIPEGTEDSVYLSVKRTVNGATVRYIECISGFAEPTRTAAFFVDCGLVYSGAAATTFRGLDHLEGRSVDVLADGYYIGRKTVASGTITISKPASYVVVGLPIVADLQLPPWAAAVEALGQGRPKNIGKAALRVQNAGPFQVGPSFSALTSANRVVAPNLTTDEIDVSPTGTWSRDGSICIRVTDPLPCTVLGLTLTVSVGG